MNSWTRTWDIALVHGFLIQDTFLIANVEQNNQRPHFKSDCFEIIHKNIKLSIAQSSYSNWTVFRDESVSLKIWKWADLKTFEHILDSTFFDFLQLSFSFVFRLILIIVSFLLIRFIFFAFFISIWLQLSFFDIISDSLPALSRFISLTIQYDHVTSASEDLW